MKRQYVIIPFIGAVLMFAAIVLAKGWLVV